jgi:hypothetical protein
VLKYSVKYGGKIRRESGIWKGDIPGNRFSRFPPALVFNNRSPIATGAVVYIRLVHQTFTIIQWESATRAIAAQIPFGDFWQCLPASWDG